VYTETKKESIAFIY